jgi:hypothetical protein
MRTDQAYPTHSKDVVLAVSLELAASKSKVALHDGQRCIRSRSRKPRRAFRRCWT